jgi:hypothetical protein
MYSETGAVVTEVVVRVSEAFHSVLFSELNSENSTVLVSVALAVLIVVLSV